MKVMNKITAVGIGVTVGFLTGNPMLGLTAASLTNAGLNAIAPDKKHRGNSTSQTYSFGPLKTASNNCLAVPILYGSIKQAGNIIYNRNITSEINYRLISFGFGKIDGFEDIRINDIPIGTLPGCSCTEYTGDGTQLIDTRVEGSTNAERAEKVGGLKHVAYLAITATASDKVNSNYSVTARVNGRKVRIYTDTTTYTESYSTNPAWALLDLFTNKNGIALSHSQCDIQSFIDAASYCDSSVTTAGTGTVSTTNGNIIVTGVETRFTTELDVGQTITVNTVSRTVLSITSNTSLIVTRPFDASNSGVAYTFSQERYKINYSIDIRDDNRSQLAEILKSCNGYYFYINGKYYIKIEKAESAVQLFDESNILAGSESIRTSSREDNWDIVKAQYVDPYNEDAKVYAIAEATEIENSPAIIFETSIYAVTNANQALRLANFAQRKARNTRLFYSFTANKEGMDRTIGDVILSTSPTFGWTTKLFRIDGIKELSNGNYQIDTRVYDSTIYDDSVSAGGPSVNISLLKDVSLTPDNISYFYASQNHNFVQFNWQEINGENITYEIREGSNWANSSVIATKLTGNTYNTILGVRGTLNYWIKAKNKFGNYASTPKQAILVVDSIPFRNVVVTTDLLGTTLTHSDTFKTAAGYVAIVSNTTWSDLSSLTWADLAAKKWGDYSKTEGTVTSSVQDIGGIYTSVLSLKYNINAEDDNVYVLHEARLSDDNIIWTDWVTFVAGEYAFRYYQFRCTVYSPSGKYAILEDWEVIIDVPDRNERYTDKVITVAASGVTIYFATDVQSIYKRDFVATPSVVANITNNVAGYTKIIKTTAGCNVKAYDNTGTAITANVDVHVQGY
jgi:hypothetical protein